MSISVSVVMSVFNTGNYLKESIESILNQTFKDFEFIIINDGSTDRSLEIIKSYNDDRIILINQENTGLAAALNNGIAIAKSDYIARMDADDISLPNRLKLQYEFMENHPECVAVGSNAELIDEDNNFVCNSSQLFNFAVIKKRMIDSIKNDTTPFTPFFHSSVIFRKNTFILAGKYPVFMKRAQDVFLFHKMLNYGELLNLKEKLIKYRIVSTANSLRGRKDVKYFSIIIKKAIVGIELSSEEIAYIEETSKKTNIRERKLNYHIYLAKKYLWNNYIPVKSRKHCLEALKFKSFKLTPYLLFLASFFPQNFITFFYKQMKNLQ